MENVYDPDEVLTMHIRTEAREEGGSTLIIDWEVLTWRDISVDEIHPKLRVIGSIY